MALLSIFAVHRAAVLSREAALKIRLRRWRRSVVSARCGISRLHKMYWGRKGPFSHRWLAFSASTRRSLSSDDVANECRVAE